MGAASTEAGEHRPGAKYDRLIAAAKAIPAATTIVVHPCDESSLRGVADAAAAGIIKPVLVGPSAKIRAVAFKHGIEISAFELVDVPHSEAAAAKAVELIHAAKGEMLMKGSLHTDELMRSVTAKAGGLRTERRISHVFVMDVPAYSETIFVTDAAINIFRTSIVEASDSSSFSRCSLSVFSVWYARLLRRVAGVGELTQPVRLVGVGLGVLDHPLHLVLGEARAAFDLDLLLVARAEVFRGHVVIPFASMSKPTSICGMPRGAGGMPTSWNLPSVLPDAEATALVRHCSRLFNTGANLRVPLIALILRKAYGLGAQAMAGGGLHEPLLTIGWPTAELGAMGLEGAVRLGLKRELDAIDDADAREQRVREMTAHAHEHAKALNAATLFELDDVIDPADSRRLISATLAAAGRERAAPGGRESRRPVDTW